MKKTTIERNTKETSIRLELEQLTATEAGSFTGSCQIGFFDHMLTAFCVHGHFRMNLTMKGDLEVDQHHSLEDLGIVLGQALRNVLFDDVPRVRYGCALIPMDEALARCVIDLSGRPYLVNQVSFSTPFIGGFESCMFQEFFYALCMHAGITLHLKLEYGLNDHHKAEAAFKAFAHALSDASQPKSGAVLSTKGLLDS